MNGYIKLHRSIEDHWVNTDPVALHFWVNMLLRANHADNEVIHKNKRFTIKRGQIFTTVRHLAIEFKMSKSSMGRLIKEFIDAKMLSWEKTGTGQTILTVCKYSDYQGVRDSSGTDLGQSWDNSGTIQKKNKKNNIDSLSPRAKLQPMETYGYDTDKFSLGEDGLLAIPPEERAVWLKFMTEEELDLAIVSFTPNENYRGGDNLQKHARNHLQSCVRRNKLTSSHRQPSKSASDLMREILAEEDRNTT